MLDHFTAQVGPGATDVPGARTARRPRRRLRAGDRADLAQVYHYDLGDWLRGERDWRDLFELLDELPLGSRYVACLQEDMELAARQGRRPKHPPPDSPGWSGFDKHSL